MAADNVVCFFFYFSVFIHRGIIFQAIRIDDFDTNSAVYNATTEFIEFGLEYGESMDLLPGANGNGTAKSIRSSLSSTISYT